MAGDGNKPDGMEELWRSEELLKKIFESSSIAKIITCCVNKVVVGVNASFLELFGYTKEQLMGAQTLTSEMFEQPVDRAHIDRIMENEGAVINFRTALKSRDGQIKQVLLCMEKLKISDKDCVITTINDLTKANRMEAEIKKAKDRYVLAAGAAKLGIWDWDIKNDVLEWDEYMYALYEIDNEKFTGAYETWASMLAPEELARSEYELHEALAGKKEYNTEFIIHLPDGKKKHIKAMGKVLFDEQGNPERMTGVNYDITEAEVASQKLQESEKRYRSLFENSYAVQLIIDTDTGKIIDANAAACEYYGYSAEVLRTMNLVDINTTNPETLRSRIKQTYDKKQNVALTSHIRADGSIRNVEIFGGRVDIDGGKPIHVIVFDVTEKIEAERRLVESEKRFQNLIESAPDGVFVISGLKLLYANPMAARIIGAKSGRELVGKSINEILSESSCMEVAEFLEGLLSEDSPMEPSEGMITLANGRVIYIEVSVVPYIYDGIKGQVVFMRDISARKELELAKHEMEMQLRQKQKLESIGTLAGGVAHEINNPINGIINYAQLIADGQAAENCAMYSQEIIKEGERIAEIVSNLLKFARHEKHEHSPAQISDIIGNTVSLVRAVMRNAGISVEIDIPPGLPSLKCRSQQIQQVLMNLLTNARDALNLKYKGYDDNKMILINCSLFRSEGRRWIRTIVEDHGVGIPEDIMEKMFDPFFTTKLGGEGTGLGLSISHGIVTDHHGKLYFKSEPGHYTKAFLELPVDNGWDLEEGSRV